MFKLREKKEERLTRNIKSVVNEQKFSLPFDVNGFSEMEISFKDDLINQNRKKNLYLRICFKNIFQLNIPAICFISAQLR